MSKFDNSIDSQIFMALTVSKKCGVPILILGNSGCGKSSVVKEYCDINGYKSVLLRISNETPDTLTGFPTVNGEENAETRSIAARHVRPDWFQEILDNKEKGFTSVLFLDEITTSNVMVQGAALNLVFDRRCAGEYLPEDTLIVAAGNYFGNLSNEATVIPPMLNRFCIVNIIPNETDLDTFLCKYDGAQAGRQVDMHDELRKTWESLQGRKKDLSRDFISKAGEIIESSIKLECKQLIREGKLDLGISDYQDMYTDQETLALGNFISLRSLNFLRDITLAFYECFGAEGIESSNFANMVHGVAGIALGPNPQAKNEHVKNNVSERLWKGLCTATQEIERLNNNKLPEYIQFFVSSIPDDGGSFDVGTLATLKNKLKEFRGDPSIKDIKTPLGMDIIRNIFTAAENTIDTQILKNYRNVQKMGGSSRITDMSLAVEPEVYIGHVELWNKIAEVIIEVKGLVEDNNKGYSFDKQQEVMDRAKDLSTKSYTIRIIKTGSKDSNKPLFDMIPQILTF